MRSLPNQLELFDVLYGIAARDGRGEVLFGSDILLARQAFERMLIGSGFPQVYLEFPLIGEPFLDITVLYGQLEEGTRVDSPAAAGTGATLDWFADVHRQHSNVSFGLLSF